MSWAMVKKVLQKTLKASFGGLFAFGGVLWAASTADLALTLRVQDQTPPAAVADLAAAPVVGQKVLLTWTAPDENGNLFPGSPEAVTSYVIKYATFSVDSLAGDTTSWWTLATTATFPPLTPGVPGAGEFIDLDPSPKVRYWFAIRSLDDAGFLSPMDARSTTSGQQAYINLNPLIPAPVAIRSLTESGGVYTLRWYPTTLNTDGSTAIDLSGYRVYRSTSLTSGFVLVSTFSNANSGFSFAPDPVNDYYYLVRTVNDSGIESPLNWSNYIYVSPSSIVGLIGKDKDGSLSRAYVPGEMIPEVLSAGNYVLSLNQNTDPFYNRDVQRILGTYDVTLSVPGTGVVKKDFALSRPLMTVSLQYTANPSANAGNIGVLWWNGTTWIKLGVGENSVNETLRTVSFTTGLPGVYQVRMYQKANALNLDSASVFPRLFTPNGDGINDVTYFALENPNDVAVRARILDLSGGVVSELPPAGSNSPVPGAFVWDGKNTAGHIVPAGVYIYRIEGEGKTFTGTVVLAQ